MKRMRRTQVLENQRNPGVPTSAEAATHGSTVHVEDVELGVTDTYTLMTGDALDFDAGHVSLASPIGMALIGCRPGMVVAVDTPQRRRTLRIVAVRDAREVPAVS